MPSPSALACVRCSTSYPIARYWSDCPACRAAAAPANLTVLYEEPPGAKLDPYRLQSEPSSLWRWEAFLPAPAQAAVTLGEGNTPLLPAPGLGLGDLWIKDESRNPTGSFKDRLASVSVTMARRLGARVIAASSSGNAGAAAAAYAAKASIPCIVFAHQHVRGPLLAQMRACGAMLVLTETLSDRWRLQAEGVRALGWYPTSPYLEPVVGSNPFGIEGYKTIACEIAQALRWQAPDWCVLPVCYGDALYGMWKGFEELKALGWIGRTPRFAAAETSGSLSAALASGAAMPPLRDANRVILAASIGAAQSTLQALEVLRRSHGAAIAVGEEELLAWMGRLAKAEGLLAEPAAVAPLAAIERLRRKGTIARNERVVALLTASGLKEESAAAAALPPPPLIGGGLDELLRALHRSYGFSHA
jgi:threonine synthase